MSADIITAIFLFALASTITPGPNNIMLTSAGLNFGVQRCVGMAAGIYIGFPVMVIAVGLGLGAVFSSFPNILKIMNIVGISYLLYLAYGIATSEPQDLSQDSNAHTSKPPGFIQMALFQWVNPKAWIMATGAVATFVQPHISPSQQVLIISAIFFLVAIPCTMLWLTFGAKLRMLIGSPESQRMFNQLMAIILVVSLVPIFKNFFG